MSLTSTALRTLAALALTTAVSSSLALAEPAKNMPPKSGSKQPPAEKPAEDKAPASKPTDWSTAPKVAPSDALKKLAADLPAGKEYAIIITSHGPVTIELLRDKAPKTVGNFQKLLESGYYNGLSFHRVIPGFMAQGGCPLGTGTGGPGWTVPAEFNDTPHLRGTVAMARTADPNSAGSQFYICFQPTPHLNNQYTVFGQTISGMEAVDKLKNGDKMTEAGYFDKRK